MRRRCLLVSVIGSLLLAGPLRADDGAASIAAGGLVLMKREPRIVMAKEVLSISAHRVLVDYDFRNDSNEDITTEVAFPIPAYSLDSDEVEPLRAGFDDFKLWIAGEPVKFTVETRAFVGKRDVTALLLGMRVDPGSMGHYKNPVYGPETVRDIDRLNPAQKLRMRQAGAIESDSEGHRPLWRIEKKYHWTQIFPAHAVVHIRHQYTPVLGNSNSVGDTTMEGLRREVADPTYELGSVCATNELLRSLQADANKPDHVVSIAYVDFILTTANTWKQPIEDFSLIVEKPPLDHDPNHPTTDINLVSFCWNGPVTKIDATHFSAHATNFIPAKELRIGFLQGYLMNEQ